MRTPVKRTLIIVGGGSILAAIIAAILIPLSWRLDLSAMKMASPNGLALARHYGYTIAGRAIDPQGKMVDYVSEARDSSGVLILEFPNSQARLEISEKNGIRATVTGEVESELSGDFDRQKFSLVANGNTITLHVWGLPGNAERDYLFNRGEPVPRH